MDQVARFWLLFYEDLPHWWKELVLLGNLDNDVLQLEVSFLDRVAKLRELFVGTFPTLDRYKECCEAKKKIDPDYELGMLAVWRR
jgi:hypothetical protein